MVQVAAWAAANEGNASAAATRSPVRIRVRNRISASTVPQGPMLLAPGRGSSIPAFGFGKRKRFQVVVDRSRPSSPGGTRLTTSGRGRHSVRTTGRGPRLGFGHVSTRIILVSRRARLFRPVRAAVHWRHKHLIPRPTRLSNWPKASTASSGPRLRSSPNPTSRCRRTWSQYRLARGEVFRLTRDGWPRAD